MAAAILSLDKASKNKSASRRSGRASTYIRRESVLTRAGRLAGKSLFYGFIVLIVAALVSIFGFYYFYTHYAAAVDQRIDSGFWHTRAGLYAAPYKLRKGQKISQEKVVEQLRRSGYVENTVTDRVWNGSFTAGENEVEIHTNNYYNTGSATAIVKFSGGEIAAITDQQSPLDEFEIHPEMLTGRSEAKRGVNHALRYEEIPATLRNAILMAEDQRFFEHRGVDPQGVLRAVYKNITDNRISQGGSTITQQLVKNTFLTPEKTFVRKFSEAFLALALENRMSKEDIFALYCNEIYLGQYGATGIHGVEQAARAYFDKDLKDITLTEAATIAAMIKNPNRYAPHKNSDEAKLRREWIIGRLKQFELVSSQEYEIALNSSVEMTPPKPADRTIAPYFVDAATKALSERFERDVLNTNFNLRVYTTIDTELQERAEQAVAGHLARLNGIYEKKGLTLQASLVALDPHNGHIVAMVGGEDYRRSQFNRATEAKRQPGSTFKPFVYATALERGLTPMSVFSDRPSEFSYDNGQSYKPANYGNSYTNDEITMKTALARSSNVVAVETAMQAGIKRVAEKAEEFGFENVPHYPSLALGAAEVTPLELAAAYAAFANGGKRIKPTYVARIVSGESDVLFQSRPGGKEIISDKTAFMITDMLGAVVERGTAQKASGALGKTAFVGKTGSSKDGWFVGYTPNLVTVVWVGFDENEDVKQTGGEIALPLWTKFMQAALDVRPEYGGEQFPMPKGLNQVTIDPETGMQAHENCPHKETVVVPAFAASSITCWRHEPRPELLLAEDSTGYELPAEPLVVLPSRVVVETETPAPAKIEYKSVDGVPVPKEVKRPAATEGRPVKSDDLVPEKKVRKKLISEDLMIDASQDEERQ